MIQLPINYLFVGTRFFIQKVYQFTDSDLIQKLIFTITVDSDLIYKNIDNIFDLIMSK